MKCIAVQQKRSTQNGSVFVYEHACGQCMACRIRRREEWMTRILMENCVHASSLFVTLTYDLEHCPPSGSLCKRDVQLFLKRLRKCVYPRLIRHFIVGEYGSRSQRPHYHAVLFGLELDDEKVIGEAWKNGFVTLSELNRSRARYAARYIMKKLTSPGSFSDGRAPEFSIMSKRPGLGVVLLHSVADSALRGGISTDVGPFQDVKAKVMLSTTPGYIRIDGKKCPLDPFLKEKLSRLLGDPGRSTLRRAIANESKTNPSMTEMEATWRREQQENKVADVVRRSRSGEV